MYDIMKKYVENENTNGLLLVDMPTGSGKTYSAIQFIYDSCMNPDNKKRKYIFVTTLKKNLPFEDLKKRFEESGNSNLYDEKVLVIDSNMDSVIDGWNDEVDKSIPLELKNTEEYKIFKREVSCLKKSREKKNEYEKDFIFSIEEDFRRNTEKRFRNMIVQYFSKEFNNIDKKLMAIKTNPKWHWIGQLYPAAFTRDKQVLFMSMDKFLSRNTTIVEPSYMFVNSDIIKEAVIFIDEFDATKETILKNIINNGLRDKVNYIELFKDIYSALHMDEFPTVLTTPSRQYIEKYDKKRNLSSLITRIREISESIFDTFSLRFKHRTIGEMEDTYQNYMFQDHQYHSILSDTSKKFISMRSDTKQKINNICFETKKPIYEKNNIQSMLGQLRGFVTFFCRAVYILSINYLQNKNERRSKEDDEFTMESSIKSVLDLFRLNNDSIDYLTSQILITSRKDKNKFTSSDFDLSFYDKGFRYYAFENDKEHDMQSQIMMYSFQLTPEKILLRYCEKAKVIGISATATVPTVLGNFDIGYLKDKMQELFVELDGEEKRRLAQEFNEQQNYENVNIHTELLGSKISYSKESWYEVFLNQELAENIYDMIQRLFGENDDNGDYAKERYLRISLAFKQFVTHNDIHSFLCVLTKHPRANDKYLDRNTLHTIFKYIAKENGWKDYKDNVVVYLDGSEYDDKKNTMIERLAAGEKLFVISVYQTIGAGQNLQYPVPERLQDSVVKINERNTNNEKDFDAIYLDKPTNLIVQLGDNLDEKEFAKYIFQMEFLQEKGELSVDDTIKNIKRAFRTYMMGHSTRDFYADVYHKQSYVSLSTRYVIQAIGRICRTNKKNKNVYVYAANNIAESIDVSIVKGRQFNYEFMALVDEVKRYGAKTPEQASLENIASLKSIKVNKDITNMLEHSWTQDKVDKWKTLRLLTLQHPNPSKEDADSNFAIKAYYIELPEKMDRIHYSQEEDFNNVSVSFKQDQYHTNCLCSANAKLDLMMTIPKVKEYFETNGWATKFVPNDYIMTPPLWNNIYKGALGEVVGEFLFDLLFREKLEEIENLEYFELFDYKVSDSSIYVDFKNWQEGITENKNGILNKIAEKAKICNAECVLVINVVAENEWNVSRFDYEGIHIVSVPYLALRTNGETIFNQKAFAEIKECLDEYKYHN